MPATMTRVLFLLAMAAACAVAAAADDAPVVFRAETGTFFRPGYRVESKGGTLVYEIVLYSDAEKGVVTLKSEKITPTPAQWRDFRHALDRIGVWQWQDKYEVIEPDGGAWSLEIKYADKEVNSEGDNGYPGPDDKMPQKQGDRPTELYRELMAAIKKLLGGRLFDAMDDDDHGLYAVMAWPLPAVVFRQAGFSNVMEFLRNKGTEFLRHSPAYKDAEMKFVYHFDTTKPREALTYERGNVSYATAFREIMAFYGLDYEMLAPDRILIKDREGGNGDAK
jgi:hypothetical protein